MIVNDQSPATLVATSVLSIGLFFSFGAVASAAETSAVGTALPVVQEAASPAAPSPDAQAVTVTVVQDGSESMFSSSAHTVGDVLDERGIHVATGDYLTPAVEMPIVAGTRIVIRTAEPIELRVGSSTRAIHSSAVTVAALLREQHVSIARSDLVSPPLSARVLPNETIQIVRVRSWTSHERVGIAPRTVQRSDATLASGKMKTLVDGSAGLRETVVRYTRHDDDEPTRTILASRIVREPRPRIVIRGIATYQSLARVATQGFESAVHMAGSALHMIATAYTSGCFGCSGITASGVRAGFGIIAVDPSVIPLGTKVFIPGYGRAVAGDTGGAIQGHRVDLGFNSESAALEFGRRPVTIYVLR